MKDITERESNYRHLEKMSVTEILSNINKEDSTVAESVARSLPQITALAEAAVETMKRGGRLFYIGAGTSGRLGILDASECPPTFGVPDDWILALIAGGDSAIRKAVEFAEDDHERAWFDLKEYGVDTRDMVVGIAASGRMPYVLGGLRAANQAGITTGCIVCNEDSPIAAEARYAVEVTVGPEFVTGSTRMKAGTAQKMVLNMLSTTVMIQMGRIHDNKMVDMQLTNDKLFRRGVRIIMEETGIDASQAAELLDRYGSVRKAIDRAQTGESHSS